LAELLVTNSVPEVWVPPVPVREVRSLMAHRQRLVHQPAVLIMGFVLTSIDEVATVRGL
jgi:hypothetical protein